MTATELWAAFAAKSGIDPSAAHSAWHFCDNEQDANELADLVFAGIKRATASCLWIYEHQNEALPKAGDYSIILDWAGNARGIIRTTVVDIVRFCDVSAEFAAIEGEGDGSLAYWRDGHTRFFTRECESIGRVFSADMPVVCEQFAVVCDARTL